MPAGIVRVTLATPCCAMLNAWNGAVSFVPHVTTWLDPVTAVPMVPAMVMLLPSPATADIVVVRALLSTPAAPTPSIMMALPTSVTGVHTAVDADTVCDAKIAVMTAVTRCPSPTALYVDLISTVGIYPPITPPPPGEVMVNPVPVLSPKSREFIAVSVDPPTGVNVMRSNPHHAAVFVVPLPVVIVATPDVVLELQIKIGAAEVPVQAKAFVSVTVAP